MRCIAVNHSVILNPMHVILLLSARMLYGYNLEITLVYILSTVKESSYL
jgi:hypothetical protein